MEHLPFFFIPTPGELRAQGSSPPGNFPSKAENIANARGSARAGRGGGGGVWAQLELTDALLTGVALHSYFSYN